MPALGLSNFARNPHSGRQRERQRERVHYATLQMGFFADRKTRLLTVSPGKLQRLRNIWFVIKFDKVVQSVRIKMDRFYKGREQP